MSQLRTQITTLLNIALAGTNPSLPCSYRHQEMSRLPDIKAI
jgi:hypothetical protein